jgi:putative phosphoribosyl transferase
MPLAALLADHESIVPRCAGYTAGMLVLPFPDRRAAGRLLADKLKDLCSEQTVVLALPRGGVPVASEIATACGATLDVIVTRKIGAPRQPELGVGAIAEGMRDPVYDDWILARLGLTPADLAATVAAEKDELARRVRVYRPGRPPPDVAGRPVIVVDDGLATGVTARAALGSLRAGTFGTGAPGSLILAVPVAPRTAATALAAGADRVVSLVTPRRFASVGEWYDSFPQLADADVLALLPGLPGVSRHTYGAVGRADGAMSYGCRAKGQAALARRMRRRRSAERSSSLSPPQVPYFSGRETA